MCGGCPLLLLMLSKRVKNGIVCEHKFMDRTITCLSLPRLRCLIIRDAPFREIFRPISGLPDSGGGLLWRKRVFTINGFFKKGSFFGTQKWVSINSFPVQTYPCQVSRKIGVPTKFRDFPKRRITTHHDFLSLPLPPTGSHRICYLCTHSLPIDLDGH